MRRVTIVLEDDECIAKIQAEVWCALKKIMLETARAEPIPSIDPTKPSLLGEQEFRMHIPWVECIQWEHTRK
jgi:hypothetical protein